MIDEIKALMGKISPWPWTYKEEVINTGIQHISQHFDGVVDINGRQIIRITNKDLAQFIAKSPEYINYLLTELEKRDKMEKCCKHESYETMPVHLSDGRIVDSLYCKCCICGEYIDNPTTGERE